MLYETLVDKVIKRGAAHERILEGDAAYAFSGVRRTDQRTEIQAHLAGERIVDSPALLEAIAAVEKAEEKIRRTKLSGIPGKEVREFEKSIFSDLILAVENRKCKRLKELSKSIDEKRKKYNNDGSFGDATRGLLKLEESKLRYAKVSESDAMVNLARFENKGYSREDLLVLGAVSERTSIKAAEVKAVVPEYLSSAEGMKILQEMETIIAQRPGEVSYFFKGSEQAQSIPVADLVSQVQPTIKDVV